MYHDINRIKTGAGVTKRGRSVNYSLDEKSSLLQLVEKYKTIVENKKTDGTSNQIKEQTWQKIAAEFNAISPGMVYRDATSLHKVYKNIKKDVRKAVAEERMETIKTGGGTAKPKRANPLQEQALATMNLKTVYGMENLFDSDTSLVHINDENDDDTERDANIVDGNNTDHEILYIQMEKPSADDIGDMPAATQPETAFNWAKSTPTDFCRPINPTLTKKVRDASTRNVVPPTEDNDGEAVASLKSRRRPTASAVALHSSEISKLYSKVCKEKLDIAAMEKQIVAQNLEFQQEKHRVELEMAKTELAIKKLQYDDCLRTVNMRK